MSYDFTVSSIIGTSQNPDVSSYLISPAQAKVHTLLLFLGSLHISSAAKAKLLVLSL